MIPYGRHYVDEDDVQAVAEVLRHGTLTQGPKIPEFEQAVAAYVGVRYAVAVSSGTAALHLACLAAGVGRDENIVTTPNTFVASANCALYVGALPQFADIDPETLNLAPEALANKCAELKVVKAIIPVHFAGLPCEMQAIKSVADEYRAIVIEDASHALGATYDDGSRVGNCRYSDMTVFSFHPVKAIAAGEGGMITTNNEELYRRLLRLRGHGVNKADDPFENSGNAFENGELNRWYYEMQELGFNYRITDIQSALALSQMGKLDRFLSRRRDLAARYDAAFDGLKNLSVVQRDGRPISAHHLYVTRINFPEIGMSRTQLMSALMKHGIGTQVHYIPVFMHPYYQKRGYDGDKFPVAQRYYREALSIPMFYALTDEQLSFVIGRIQELVR